MKRKSREIPVLAQLLFPETYQDAVDALLKHMPYLRPPEKVSKENAATAKEMSKLLAQKASFVTFLAMGSSCEIDWDIKEEAGEEVEMCIFLPDESLSGAEKISDEELRMCTNYSFVNRMVADHAHSFGRPIKRLPHYK